MRKIVVTGHLGFIGSAFCHLFNSKYEIIGIDFNGIGSSRQNIAPNILDIFADIADQDSMKTVFNNHKPDAIINFAAESHVDRSNDDDACFWHSNVMGPRILSAEVIRLGIRMVQVSTDEVYGDAVSNSSPWTEESEISPANPYAVTKASAEMLLKVRSKHGLDLIITRGANTIGPRQFSEKAVPKAIDCFLNDKEFPLFRTPAKRMWMYVDDHAKGIEAALCNGKSGESYNLAPSFENEALTSDVIKRVKEIIGKGEIEEVDDRLNYDLRYWMDASKAKKELGWEAKYNLEETIQNTVKWYLEKYK